MATLITVLAIVNIVFVLCVAINAESMGIDRKTFVLCSLKNTIPDLFTNKNIFGIFLSSIIILINIPGIIFIVLVELLLWIICLFVTIYDLGTRKR